MIFERELVNLFCCETISGDSKESSCCAPNFIRLTFQILPNALVKKCFIALIKLLVGDATLLDTTLGNNK